MRKQVGFWRLVFIVSPLIDVTLQAIFAIFVSKTFHVAGLLPPFFHPGDHFVRLGTPYGTMGAAGRTRGGPEPDF